MWDHKGKRLWSHAGKLKDHVDAVAVGNFSADPKAPPRVYWATSDEGFIMLDLKGNILKHTIVGHTQTAAVGKFRPDLPGLQYATTNFWRNPGIVSVFDADGNMLTQGEPIHTGSVTLPVNWRGDGQEFVLLSGNVVEGGMIDGHLRRVVMFPDDGHPDLTAAGAGRDRRRRATRSSCGTSRASGSTPRTAPRRRAASTPRFATRPTTIPTTGPTSRCPAGNPPPATSPRPPPVVDSAYRRPTFAR